jgi:hypothetical protein
VPRQIIGMCRKNSAEKKYCRGPGRSWYQVNFAELSLGPVFLDHHLSFSRTAYVIFSVIVLI